MEEIRNSSTRPRVLVVDDEPDMLEFLARALRRTYQVTVAHSAEEALPLLQSDDFQMVITDNQMLRLSGLEMLARLENSSPELVRVVMSGFDGDPEIQRAIDRGMLDSYVLKPLDSPSLMSSIDQARRIRAKRANRVHAERADRET
jgi:DNA-binding NtrC family response regulator